MAPLSSSRGPLWSAPLPDAQGAQRSFGLDLVRAIAILNVLWGHGRSLLPEDIQARFPVLRLDGVTIFFALSGFLIGRIMMRNLAEGASLRTLLRFWARRWLRTLPAYFVTLALLVLLASRFGRTALPATLSDYLWFGQNLAAPHPDFFGEAWSLAVEEWFYLLVPLAVWGLVGIARMHPRRAVGAVALVTIALVFVTRQLMLDTTNIASLIDWDSRLRKLVITRMDSLMFGVLAAWCWVHAGELTRRWAPLAGLIGLVGLTVSLMGLDLQADFRDTTRLLLLQVPLMIALILPAMALMRQAPAWLAEPVAFISRLAYPLYLLHYGLVMLTVLPVLGWRIELDWTSKVAVYWSLSFGLAWLMHWGVERPGLWLRDRWLPEPASSGAAREPSRGITHRPPRVLVPARRHLDR
jgi:peptidoglycan/LPS O-acetylase OafA/YrhL